MSGSPVKLVLAALALYLLLGAFTANSAMTPQGDEKSSWHVDRYGLRKMLRSKEGNFGSQNVSVSKKVVPTRNLRTVTKKSAPPPPSRNKASTQRLLLYLQSLPDAC